MLVSSNAVEGRRPSLPAALETRASRCLNYSEALAAIARIRTEHGFEVKKLIFFTHLASGTRSLANLGNSDPHSFWGWGCKFFPGFHIPCNSPMPGHQYTFTRKIMSTPLNYERERTTQLLITVAIIKLQK